MEQGCDETDISAFAWLGRDWEGLGRIGLPLNWRLMLTHPRPTGSRGWSLGLYRATTTPGRRANTAKPHTAAGSGRTVDSLGCHVDDSLDRLVGLAPRHRD